VKVHLMFRDRDFDPKEALPVQSEDLRRDLGLDVLFAAMAAGDGFLLEIVQKAVLTSLAELREIVFRQDVLADCLEQRAVVREMYAIAVEALERERKIWGWTLNRYPEGLLHRSLDVLEAFLGLLKRLRRIADQHAADFRSEGFRTLFAMLARELSDEYLREVEDHLARLRFRHGMLLSAELGPANKGTHYVIRQPHETRSGLLERVQTWVVERLSSDRQRYVYRIAERDEAGLQALGQIRSRGVGQIASNLGESADHILGFFQMLRAELAFHIGCLNLCERLEAKGEPLARPEPLPAGQPMLHAQGLYDVSLSLSMPERVVGNDLSADHKQLVMITGANRGGKTTLMRGIGQAQLMMQCGSFVPAASFRADVRRGLFTHYKREEDPTMKSGKLDEELGRMSAIVEHLARGGIVLLNESFASTNEREGSEIARQVVRSLLEAGIKVFYVTHLFDLAESFCRQASPETLFLRAERLPDGGRTFRVVEGEPLPTSYGADLYRRIFRLTTLMEASDDRIDSPSGHPGDLGSLRPGA
jgi:DNA mismatch repair ATPase MutS